MNTQFTERQILNAGYTCPGPSEMAPIPGRWALVRAGQTKREHYRWVGVDGILRCPPNREPIKAHGSVYIRPLDGFDVMEEARKLGYTSYRDYELEPRLHHLKIPEGWELAIPDSLPRGEIKILKDDLTGWDDWDLRGGVVKPGFRLILQRIPAEPEVAAGKSSKSGPIFQGGLYVIDAPRPKRSRRKPKARSDKSLVLRSQPDPWKGIGYVVVGLLALLFRKEK